MFSDRPDSVQSIFFNFLLLFTWRLSSVFIRSSVSVDSLFIYLYECFFGALALQPGCSTRGKKNASKSVIFTTMMIVLLPVQVFLYSEHRCTLLYCLLHHLPKVCDLMVWLLVLITQHLLYLMPNQPQCVIHCKVRSLYY